VMTVGAVGESPFKRSVELITVSIISVDGCVGIHDEVMMRAVKDVLDVMELVGITLASFHLG